eukprot:TRINITY_DN6278_c0_g1_i14.p2 TRINITY_DN6278_c0_g1~~TRINITY_DN6278_c0_g1_i14.p2  ORF type:complete len:185 (-),score=51.84 TRINITY_DN6278_c0_g1_i14:122-676(-)
MRQMQMKAVNDNELKIEKTTKLIEENATLREKLNESDFYRKKFQEKNQGLEADVKRLEKDKKELDTQIVALQKRVKDLSAAKSTNQKILEEKCAKALNDCENLKKENEQLKGKVRKLEKAVKNIPVTNDDDDEEVLEPVQAKPYLFGPVDKKFQKIAFLYQPQPVCRPVLKFRVIRKEMCQLVG